MPNRMTFFVKHVDVPIQSILTVTLQRNLWVEYIEDIYFFEVNTKYISSNVLKISVIARVKLLIFSIHEMK